ncbi:hypothetical protein GGF39_003838, partial [Coemansia sp. RSA 1721]
MPTEEEQKARVAEWEAKLVGKRLEDDVTDKQQDTPAQAASSDDAAEKKDDTEDSNKEKQQESSVVEVVKLSGLPQPVRVIKPGSRVTRDLRPNRMNVVSFTVTMGLEDSNHANVSSISKDMTLKDVKDKLGEPSEISGNTYKWTCPGNSAKCISIEISDDK